MEEGIDVPERGLDGWEATGTELALPYLRAQLAETCLITGRRQEALEALDEALSYPEEVW